MDRSIKWTTAVNCWIARKMLKKGYETVAAEEDDDEDQSSHPMIVTSDSFFSLLTLSWMNSIFKLGSQRPLNQSDFLPLHEDDRTRELTEGLQREWNDHLRECDKTAAKRPKLWKCVVKTISWKEILYQTSFWFAESVCRVSQPLVLGFLLRLLSSTEINRPLLYASCLLLSLSGISTACTHYSAIWFELLGMRLSSALKGIIYLKIPLLSQQSIRETTEGSIISLISNDVQRMEQAPRWIFTSFFAVVELVAAVVLLMYLIGWQALMGVAFLMVLIPCVIKISSICARLRQETAEVTDRRISLMNELVKGIRALKTHAWEETYREKVQEVRRSEIWILLKKNAWLSIVETLLFSSSVVAAFFAILTLAICGQVISPSIAFIVLSFMNLLRVTLSLRLGNAIPLGYELFVSFKRIERFLLLRNMPLDHLAYNQTSCSQENNHKLDKNKHAQLLVRRPSPQNEPIVQKSFSTNQDAVHSFYNDDDVKTLYGTVNMHLSVSKLTVKLKENENGEKYLLRDVSFQATEKGLTAITGQVGSGKSTLLAAIAGEVIKSDGNIFCVGTVAYVPQTAWVFPGTLRENVLFGEPYDEKKYKEVLEACALTEDINRFPNGDLSFVGEHGIALSGGQRARVNLARAVYADSDVYLLDDPLSAVDAKVGEHIFQQCICRLLKEKIVLLATYAEKTMKAADQVVVLQKGSVHGSGSFDELQKEGRVLDAIIIPSATTIDEQARMLEAEDDEKAQSDSGPDKDGFIEHLEISEEEKGTGQISSRLYWDYFRAGMHPVAMIAVVTLFLASQVVMVSPNVWLSYLTKMTGKNQQNRTTLGIYASFVSAAFLLGIIRAYVFFYGSLRAAENLHDKMVARVLEAPVLFFDINPAGRILNRFSKDIGAIDELLPKFFLLAIQLFLFVLTAAVLPSFTNFWLALVTLPTFMIFAYLAWYYLKTSRDLKRLESICRSPVFSHFSETMAGLDTIRTRKKERSFIDRFYQHQDLHNQAFSMVLASSRWLGVRADLLCSLFIAGIALMTIVLLSENPALAGLALVYVIETSNMSQYAVRQFSEVENLMTSVERVMTYTSLDSEPGYQIKTRPPINWPDEGKISFRDVVLRYYPGGPQVLKSLSFEIQGKTKLGIVGRTGDGKSSIVAALLRMPEAEGDICIDDVPINSIQLQESRRCISVLSQSPVLFSGSLRRNLDPLEKHRDDELWNVLEQVELNRLVESLEGQLDYVILERGENLSVGERQLICLARTLLQQSKIVILDEPTAHVDPNTEETIWTTVHEKLKNSTIITIAHRLNTIKDCNIILVLREGKVAELDTSESLLAREEGIFSKMAASQNLMFS